MPSKSEEPKEIECMKRILEEMNVIDYEDNVPGMLLEVVKRHVTEVIGDAKFLAQLSGKQSIKDEDIRAAAILKQNNSFTRPPPAELLMDTANAINAQQLPAIKSSQGGFKLPPDRYCQTNPSYELLHKRQKTNDGTSK